jgi:hypothetical protein
MPTTHMLPVPSTAFASVSVKNTLVEMKAED